MSKNLETRTLWVQDKIDEGKVVVEKIGGDRNVAGHLDKVSLQLEAAFTLGPPPRYRVGRKAFIGPTAAGFFRNVLSC